MSDVSLNFVLTKFNNCYFFIPLSFIKTDFFFFWYYREYGGGGWRGEKENLQMSFPNVRRSDSIPRLRIEHPKVAVSRAQPLTIAYSGAFV